MESNPLPMTLQRQCCSSWCWAAVISTAIVGLKLVNLPQSQGALVNQYYGPTVDCTGCCPGGCPDLEQACNLPALISPVLGFLQLAHGGGVVPDSRGFALIQSEIKQGHPVIAQIHYDDPPDQDHVMLIYGYAGSDTIWIGDPATGESWAASYTAYLNHIDETAHGFHGSLQYLFTLNNLPVAG